MIKQSKDGILALHWKMEAISFSLIQHNIDSSSIRTFANSPQQVVPNLNEQFLHIGLSLGQDVPPLPLDV